MCILIRKIERSDSGSQSVVDETLDQLELGIGRATNQELQIADKDVALEHARIFQSTAHQWRIKALANANVSINGHTSQDAELTFGDIIRIGRTHIRVTESDVAELMLEVESAPAVVLEEVSEAQYSTRLAHAQLSKRRSSWWLVALILMLGAIIPTISMFQGGEMSRLGILSDRIWSSGDLSGVHGKLETACVTCHASPFTRVRNAECLSCHERVTTHVKDGRLLADAHAELRCTDCHREHDEPSALVRDDEAVCTDCHRALESTDAENAIRDVADFDHSHPEFQVTFPAQNGELIRTLLADDLRQSAALKFSHQAHLSEGGVRNGQGAVIQMQCVDCHTSRPGAARLERINYEQHCQSCHTLGIDMAGQRQAQHGPADALFSQLQDYFSRQLLLEDQSPSSPEDALKMLRPGRQAPSFQSQRMAQTGDTPAAVLEQADQRAQEALQDMLGKRACHLCHNIEHEDGSPSRVKPVPVHGAWMPHARFAHDDHRQTACADCHVDVALSESSEDVLMPGIGLCKDCHGGAQAQGLIQTPCADCHWFHRPELQALGSEHTAKQGDAK